MKIDIHVHTTASFCSEFLPEELVHLAREMRVHAVVTTNHHDSYSDADYLERELSRYGILYFPGIEITNRWGDFLLFGHDLDAFQDPRNEFPVDLLPRDDIAVVWAHPFRFMPAKEVEHIKEDVITRIDAVEAINGNCTRYDCEIANDLAREMAYELNIPMVAGSDSHAPWSYFTTWTEFLDPVRNYDDFIRCIKRGRVRIPETVMAGGGEEPESGMGSDV